MNFPTKILAALGYNEPQPERPVVFLRAGHTKDSQVRRIKPDGSNAYLIRSFMEHPEKASQEARRKFRQAIVLRAVGGKLRHYPIWLLFSDSKTQEINAAKHNQLPPDIHWVRRKRTEVCKYLKVRAQIAKLESVDSLAKPKP